MSQQVVIMCFANGQFSFTDNRQIGSVYTHDTLCACVSKPVNIKTPKTTQVCSYTNSITPG